MTSESPAAIQVTVSQFTLCSCNSSLHESLHLSVKSYSTDLRGNNTIAVSYGIGNFGRRKLPFGHYEGDAQHEVVLEFGTEWIIDDLKHLLVKISEEKNAIWFDQLSIPQTDPGVVRKHLEQIPKIYGTFEVIILLPNAPCPCLAASVELYRAGKDFVEKDGGLDLFTINENCFSALPSASYHLRLWTRQEFGYAKTISIQYCSGPTTLCSREISLEWITMSRVLSGTDWLYLNPYLRECYDEARRTASEYGELVEMVTWRLFCTQQRQRYWALQNTFEEFVTFEKDLDRREYSISLVEFVLGTQLKRDANDMETHFISIAALNSGHQATVAKDYVLAIFPSGPFYDVPSGWEIMTLPELVDDGIRQYERSMSMRLKSRLPKGLFVDENGTATCKPSLYVDDQRVTALIDVYGSLLGTPFRAIGNADHMVIHVHEPSNPPLARMSAASTYPYEFAARTTNDVLNFLRDFSKVNSYSFGIRDASPLDDWADRVLAGQVAVSYARATLTRVARRPGEPSPQIPVVLRHLRLGIIIN